MCTQPGGVSSWLSASSVSQHMEQLRSATFSVGCCCGEPAGTASSLMIEAIGLWLELQTCSVRGPQRPKGQHSCTDGRSAEDMPNNRNAQCTSVTGENGPGGPCILCSVIAVSRSSLKFRHGSIRGRSFTDYMSWMGFSHSSVARGFDGRTSHRPARLRFGIRLRCLRNAIKADLVRNPAAQRLSCFYLGFGKPADSPCAMQMSDCSLTTRRQL